MALAFWVAAVLAEEPGCSAPTSRDSRESVSLLP